MPSYDNKQLDAQSQGLTRSAGLIGLVFFVGVVGYSIIGSEGHGLGDAIYMTMITLTTVGYAEVIDLSESPGGRLFTSVLLVVGVGSFLYFFSSLTAFIVEGNLDRIIWRRRMRRSLSAIDQHVILCGAGQAGRHMIRELLATERPFVLVETDEVKVRELLEQLAVDFPVVIGDATDDAVLRRAGIERAVGLCSAISNDKENLLITLSARTLRPNLRIVARCKDASLRDKLRRAGADAVISPDEIGGLRMVAELVHPEAVSFLDNMLRDKDKRLSVEEVTITGESRACGRTLSQLRGDGLDVLILAVGEPESDDWTFNPGDDYVLAPGNALVVMAPPKAQREAQERWG